MSDNTNIEWTDATWNPWHGCHKVSPGCKNCYMFRDKKRYGQNPNVVVRSKTTFNAPLKWPQKPTLCFTCSWSDWLIEEADTWRDEAYEIIRQTPWITYQILTKRIERAAGRVPDPPLQNVWLGVSVENRDTLHRIDGLRQTPAALRFLSLEPLLEDLGELDLDGIDWGIIGGESGPQARPFDLKWARNTIRQFKAAGVPLFVKQLGLNPIIGDDETLEGWPDHVVRDVHAKGALCGSRLRLKDSKGGDPTEWPTDLRVREFPK